MTRQVVGATVAVVLLLLAAYVAAYFANVKYPTTYLTGGFTTKKRPGPHWIPPAYKLGGEWAEPFFRPMHEVDKRFLRYSHWSCQPPMSVEELIQLRKR